MGGCKAESILAQEQLDVYSWSQYSPSFHWMTRSTDLPTAELRITKFLHLNLFPQNL